MTAVSPFWKQCAKGRSSISCSRSSPWDTVGSSLCESAVVSPWPGKCLPQASTPLSCNPAITARPSVSTNSGSRPKARSPMTGFCGLVFTSRTGVRLIFTPIARNSLAVTSANPDAKETVPASPRALGAWRGVAATGEARAGGGVGDLAPVGFARALAEEGPGREGPVGAPDGVFLLGQLALDVCLGFVPGGEGPQALGAPHPG